MKIEQPFSLSPSSYVSSVNSITGAVTIAAGAGITVTNLGQTITIATTADTSVTLADVSANSLTTPNSLYTMTSTIPVEFRRSGGATALLIDEPTGNIDIGSATTSSRALRITRTTNTVTSSLVPVVEIFNATTGTVGSAEIRTITTNGAVDGRVLVCGTSGYSAGVLTGIAGMAMGTVTNQAFQIFTNNTAALTINTSQLVGIGTTTPRTGIKLDINEATASTALYIGLTNAATGTGAADGSLIGLSTTGILQIRQRENLNMEFYTNDTSRMTIDNNGLVGVGISPAALIHAYTSNTGPGVASQQIRFSWGTGTSPANQSIALQGDNTGPSAISHTDGAGNSTFNAIAVKQEFGGNGFIVGISPATTAGSARTFTTRLTIDPTGTSTFVGPSLTGSQTTSGLIYTQTWNTSGVIDGGVRITITDTASGASSLPFAIYGGASATTSLFKVDKSGIVTTASNVSVGGTLLVSALQASNTSLATTWNLGHGVGIIGLNLRPVGSVIATSGTSEIVDINGSIVTASGNVAFRPLNIAYVINNTGTVSGSVVHGLRISGTETSLTGTTHTSFEIFSGASGTTSVFSVSGAGVVQAANTITSTLGITAGTSLQAGANSSILFAGRTQFQSLVNGDLWITNAAGNSFNILKLGDTTSSFPALKRNLAGLSIRVGDDSGPGRWLQGQGADVASASTIALGNGNSFELTGTTSVTLITSTGWTEGSIVTLIANESVTITNGTATSGSDVTILLAGATNFAMTANDTLTLILSSTTAGGVAWRELCRTAI